MIVMGVQGAIPKEKQTWALHVFIDELDVQVAKLLLMDLYASKMVEGHEFLLGIHKTFLNKQLDFHCFIVFWNNVWHIAYTGKFSQSFRQFIFCICT